MGISSLGVGSSILTQNVLDQLREADNAQYIAPLDKSIKAAKDKQSALDVISANIKNLSDSIGAVGSMSVYDDRKSTVSGTSVSVSAESRSDVQNFTLQVDKLATKQIEQSGSFASKTASIASGDGTLKLSIGSKDFDIDYKAGDSLEDLKTQINKVAGDSIQASIVQIAPNDFRLFLTSKETGSGQDISMSDTSGNLDASSASALTFAAPALQEAEDAEFKFNGVDITRKSNNVNDLLSGVNITLKEVGTSSVNIEQDRDSIFKKLDSFVEKYNSAMSELNRVTKSSQDVSERGIFSNESTIKDMKRALQDMFDELGGGIDMADFGINMGSDGKISIDKDIINKKLDEDPQNLKAFFSGGTFKKADSSTVELDGIFNEMSNKLKEFSGRNAIIGQYNDSLSDSISTLESRKKIMTERLDSRFEIMKKQYIAYDAMIAKLNSASNMFVQMANAQINASKQ